MRVSCSRRMNGMVLLPSSSSHRMNAMVLFPLYQRENGIVLKMEEILKKFEKPLDQVGKVWPSLLRPSENEWSPSSSFHRMTGMVLLPENEWNGPPPPPLLRE